MAAWGPLNPSFVFKQTDLLTPNAAHIFRIASTVRCEQIRLFTLKTTRGQAPSNFFKKRICSRLTPLTIPESRAPLGVSKSVCFPKEPEPRGQTLAFLLIPFGF